MVMGSPDGFNLFNTQHTVEKEVLRFWTGTEFKEFKFKNAVLTAK